MGNWFSNLWRGLGSAVGGAGNTIGQAVGGFFNPGGAASNVGQNVGKGILDMFSGAKSPSMQPAYGASRGGASLAQSFQNMLPMAGNAGRMGPDGGGLGANPAQKTGGLGKSIMDLFSGNGGQIAAGLAIPALGQAFAPKVNTPDIGSLQSVQNLRNYKNSSLPPGVEDSINRSTAINEEQQMRQLRDVYKNARPGTDYTTDSAYQRDLANLQRNQTLNRADAQANALLQFNQQELSHLSELAQTDIYNIMIKLGMDAQEAEQFKQTYSNVGSMFLQSGLGLNNFKVS